MRLTYSRRLLDHFRREAKRVFPKEAFAVLLGTKCEESIKITQLYIPDGQERLCTKRDVPYANVWLAQALKIANDVGLEVLGEIHSHPENSQWEHDTTPSSDDWKRAMQVSIVHGVCSIRKYPSGRMLSRIKFWPKLPQLKERVTI